MRVSATNTYDGQLLIPTERSFQQLRHFDRSIITVVSDPLNRASGESIMSFCLSEDGEGSVRDVRHSNRTRRSLSHLLYSEQKTTEARPTQSCEQRRPQRMKLQLLHVDNPAFLEELEQILSQERARLISHERVRIPTAED